MGSAETNPKILPPVHVPRPAPLSNPRTGRPLVKSKGRPATGALSSATAHTSGVSRGRLAPRRLTSPRSFTAFRDDRATEREEWGRGGPAVRAPPAFAPGGLPRSRTDADNMPGTVSLRAHLASRGSRFVAGRTTIAGRTTTASSPAAVAATVGRRQHSPRSPGRWVRLRPNGRSATTFSTTAVVSRLATTEAKLLKGLAPQVGLEPTTLRLTARLWGLRPCVSTTYREPEVRLEPFRRPWR